MSYWTVAAQALEEAGANDVGPRYPGHAGGFETSVTLALRPDLVQLDRRRAPTAELISPVGAVEHGEYPRAGGTSDDASRADAEIGKRLVGGSTGGGRLLRQLHQRTRVGR
jgi:creatinine amidohydrolase